MVALSKVTTITRVRFCDASVTNLRLLKSKYSRIEDTQCSISTSIFNNARHDGDAATSQQ